MKLSDQQNAPSKKKRIFGIVVCAIALLGLGTWTVWMIWMFGAAELAAKCDNGLTVWRRDPGIASSYVYEIRDSTTIIESGLRMKQLKESLDGHHCVFLGGG